MQALPPDNSDRITEYAHSDRLVTAEWLVQHMADDRLVIVESDEDPLLYEVGHIPSAVKIDWHTDLNNQVMRDYLTGQEFADLMTSRGISRDSTVVIYGDKHNWWAAYTFGCSVSLAILTSACSTAGVKPGLPKDVLSRPRLRWPGAHHRIRWSRAMTCPSGRSRRTSRNTSGYR